MAGRPREFDPERALEQAMEVFWAQGYEATSVQDLLEAMGINRGSMYDTFGDKHTLFVAAIEHYSKTILHRVTDTLEAPGSPLGNVQEMLVGWGKMAISHRTNGGCRGCFLSNTVVELAPHDPAVIRTVRSTLDRIEDSLHEALVRGVAAGELSASANCRALARFLHNTVQGLVVLGKAGARRAAVKDILDLTFMVLKA